MSSDILDPGNPASPFNPLHPVWDNTPTKSSGIHINWVQAYELDWLFIPLIIVILYLIFKDRIKRE